MVSIVFASIYFISFTFVVSASGSLGVDDVGGGMSVGIEVVHSENNSSLYANETSADDNRVNESNDNSNPEENDNNLGSGLTSGSTRTHKISPAENSGEINMPTEPAEKSADVQTNENTENNNAYGKSNFPRRLVIFLSLSEIALLFIFTILLLLQSKDSQVKSSNNK